jgi:hypothetical protein
MIKNIHMLFLVAFISLYCCYWNACNALDEKKNLIIRIEIEGNKFEKDLIQFIEENTKHLNSQSYIQNKSVMVLGLSGTGKSTLINYLNNIPLVCLKEKSKWILDLQSPDLTLQGGFSIAKIGHRIYSQTFIPAGYTAKGEQFTYIDNPGFKDTHGLSTEIANGFFREQIISNVNELKFLLLLTHSDLNERGNQFRESIKAFSHFIGAFDDEDSGFDTHALSKSIAIILTKVDNDGETDEKMKHDLRIKLQEILQDEKDNDKLSFKEEKVFNEILENNQIEIFSNPKKKGPVSTHQAEAIISLMNTKLKYANKTDLKIRAKISDTYKLKLLEYIRDNYDQFEDEFNQLFNMGITRFLKKKIEETENIYIQLNELLKNDSQINDFDNFLKNLNNQILDNEEKEELANKKKTFNFFIQLFSDEEKKFFPISKKWISDQNKSKLEYHINDILNQISEKFKIFQQSIQDSIQNGIDEFIEEKINQAVDINDIKQIESILNSTQNLIPVKSSFENFLKNLNEELLNKNEKELLLTNEKVLVNLTRLLPNDKQKQFSVDNRTWIGLELNHKIERLNKELKIYYQEPISVTYKNGVYTYKGIFANISHILNDINNKRNDIVDLKSVEIYTINSVKFDINYLINKQKYKGSKCPDLIIVSPQILFSNNKTIVDLSSLQIPNYPNGKIKANRENFWNNKNGDDGEPGLAGFNGGNMLIISNESISNDLIFISNGGIGGPGQNGKKIFI